MSNEQLSSKVDFAFIGGGIMSATLAIFIKILQPDWKIAIYERLDELSLESSDAWNNAGTGHAALCELNYTPEKSDGQIDASKAYKINEQFELSKQFWSYLVEQGLIKNPSDFIKELPHVSFVHGARNVTYLKKRFEAIKDHHLFKGMEYSEKYEELKSWIPLVMNGRDAHESVAATKIEIGTDVNFGALSRILFKHLKQQEFVNIHVGHEVRDITNISASKIANWSLKVIDLHTKVSQQIKADYVFIGAGGGALHLLEKSKIKEAKGYGGFPVSGLWLRCTNEKVIAQHHAKVYGKASVGAPPMSVPHLDSRVINGKNELLFGPFAGFSTKFLKEGSYADLFTSLNFSNIGPMVQAGWANMSLTKYLVGQVMLSEDKRIEALKEYYPDARKEDWEIMVAGQRVQIIKKHPTKGGVLEFGTEVVHSGNGTIAALLGASPGASTAVAIMLELLDKCFPEQVKGVWKSKLKEMIPSFGDSLISNKELCLELRRKTGSTLGLEHASQQ